MSNNKMIWHPASELPPIRRKKRRACPCSNTDKPKG